MWSRRKSMLSLPMVIGSVGVGVISGKYIFGSPLEEYWSKKSQEEASKESQAAGNQSKES